ncbi:MAG TPA: prepilin-type N-terminal cleavage/methylation domain-containing protein [Pyrinomonadaceae bacterium]|nr:prepilin-type N-terminal cleavage/methylation domain-containing protein [Pyrinomonadaceae bacterium]
MKQTAQHGRAGEAGFSLIELMVAMGVTLIIMALASTLVSQCFNIQRRENTRSVALADAQSALNLITREITNAGYGLQSNGIYTAESDDDAITVLADYNLNDSWDADEIVSFQLRANPNTGTDSLVRLASGAAGAAATTGTVLASSVDRFRVRYFSGRVDYDTADCDLDDATLGDAVTADKAQYVVLVLCATLPEVGTPGTAGYQPPSRVQLVSDATLRNSLTLPSSGLPKY